MPSTVYRYDPATKESMAFEAPTPPIDASQFETKALFATSKDGTRVPFFLTGKKGLPLDGSNPTMLYAVRRVLDQHAADLPAGRAGVARDGAASG